MSRFFAVDRLETSVDDRRMGSRSGWMRMAAAALSGVLVAGVFPPFNFAILVWVAMIPLLWALGSLEGKRAGLRGFGVGYLGGLVTWLIQCQWVGSVSWLGAVLLPVYLAVYWGLFGLFVAKYGKSAGRGVMGTAFCYGAVWALLELARGWVITGFSWDVLGVGFQEMPLMAQAADVLGVVGLSLVLLFFQAALLLGVKRRSWGNIAAALAVIALVAAYGAVRIRLEKGKESIRLKTLLVQLNIPQDAARMAWTDLEMHQAIEEETLSGLEKAGAAGKFPDWVMWPETALTGRILRTKSGEWGTWQINHDTIDQVRTAGKFQLIYGVNELEAEKVGDELVMRPKGRAYNSIAVQNPDGDLQTYRKNHLVIFGETIPFVDSLPWLKAIYEEQAGAEYGGSFTAGESFEPLPIAVGNRTVGAIPTVCFEDSVPRLTRKFVRPGPQVIVNVTNDGWFKQSAAAAQHFSYARFRAIEFRRPMLRCGNSGVSAAIDTTGSTAHPDTGNPQILRDGSGSHFTRGSLLTELKVPIAPSFSLYAVIGDLGILALGLAALAWSVVASRQASRL